MIQGLLDLYEAGGREHWLHWAVQLQERMDELFWDPASGECSTRLDCSAGSPVERMYMLAPCCS